MLMTSVGPLILLNAPCVVNIGLPATTKTIVLQATYNYKNHGYGNPS